MTGEIPVGPVDDPNFRSVEFPVEITVNKNSGQDFPKVPAYMASGIGPRGAIDRYVKRVADYIVERVADAVVERLSAPLTSAGNQTGPEGQLNIDALQGAVDSLTDTTKRVDDISTLHEDARLPAQRWHRGGVRW